VEVLGVAVVLLLTGCGLFSKDKLSPDFTNSPEIQRALDEAGLTCTGYQTVPKEDREWGMESAADVGKCELDNETPTLVVGKDIGQKDNWAGMSKQMGCTMGKAFGVSSFDYVSGNRWTVSDTSPTLANKIADAIGGRPFTSIARTLRLPGARSSAYGE
jgi:hypothetical protein